MSSLIVPDTLRASLAAAATPLELVSADGQLLGYFLPADQPPARLDPGISGDEIRRRFAEGGGRPLADILRDLEARA